LEARQAARADLEAAALNIGGYAQGKAWIKHNPLLGIAYGKAFTSPTNQPRHCNTTHQFFLRHNRAARKSKLKMQATQRRKHDSIDMRSGLLVCDDHPRPCAGARSTQVRRRARRDRGLERNG